MWQAEAYSEACLRAPRLPQRVAGIAGKPAEDWGHPAVPSTALQPPARRCLPAAAACRLPPTALTSTHALACPQFETVRAERREAQLQAAAAAAGKAPLSPLFTVRMLACGRVPACNRLV